MSARQPEFLMITYTPPQENAFSLKLHRLQNSLIERILQFVSVYFSFFLGEYNAPLPDSTSIFNAVDDKNRTPLIFAILMNDSLLMELIYDIMDEESVKTETVTMWLTKKDCYTVDPMQAAALTHRFSDIYLLSGYYRKYKLMDAGVQQDLLRFMAFLANAQPIFYYPLLSYVKFLSMHLHHLVLFVKNIILRNNVSLLQFLLHNLPELRENEAAMTGLLYIGLMFQSMDIIVLLIANGANPYRVDSGHSPMSYLCDVHAFTLLSIVKKLYAQKYPHIPNLSTLNPPSPITYFDFSVDDDDDDDEDTVTLDDGTEEMDISPFTQILYDTLLNPV